MRDRLEKAQQHYKAVYNRHHRPLEFLPGQWVWLRLLHRPVASLQVAGRGKLGPKFLGPFKVLEHIWDVAYRLDLPVGARIHNVFHVGFLKQFFGVPPDQPPALPVLHHGRVLIEHAAVLKLRLVRGRQELLVRWKGAPPAESSWVDLEDFRQQFPEFQLADNLFLQGGKDVMVGVPYTRRKRMTESKVQGSC